MCLNNNIIAFGVRYNNHPIQHKYIHSTIVAADGYKRWVSIKHIYNNNNNNNKQQEKTAKYRKRKKEEAPESSLFICMHNGLFII